jgi:hypothetical protein
MPDTLEIVKEVEAFYRAFMDAFNRHDVVRQSRFGDLPYALISGEGGVVVCSTPSEHEIYAIFSRFNEDWKNHTLELFTQAA